MSRAKNGHRSDRRTSRRFRPEPGLVPLEPRCLLASGWSSYAGNPQHTAETSVIAQPLQSIHWQTTIDAASKQVASQGSDILTHYGSPLVTAANTVIVPITVSPGSYAVEAFQGSNGTPLWTQDTDYTPPPHDWVPSFSPVLATIPASTPFTRLYIPAADGTVDYIDNPDSSGATISGRFAFYGLDDYNADLANGNANIEIDTPITADAAGNIYFGFTVTGANAAGLSDGIAKVTPGGFGTVLPVAGLGLSVDGATIDHVAMNCAPALSNDESTLYIGINNDDSYGDLLELSTANLSYVASVTLVEPPGTTYAGLPSVLNDDSSASPTVGPDGDVYYGVLEHTFASNHDRGWLLHFSGDLSETKDAGFFGWDDTASIVPASLVPSYTGSSSYLLMTKYNDYADPGLGGTGINQIAVLDPDTRDPDCPTGMNMMNVVLSIDGVTPDWTLRNAQHPDAVREWCINSAAVDINPATDSIYANSEDGSLYCWNLASPGTFTQSVPLTSGIGEAYTPTVIGADGTVYAINDATLFAVGASSLAPTQTTVVSSGATTVGQAVTFTVTVGPGSNGGATPTGNVALYDGTTYLGTAALNAGTASFTTSSLALGVHSITAVYLGDFEFASNFSNPSSLNQTVSLVTSHPRTPAKPVNVPPTV